MHRLTFLLLAFAVVACRAPASVALARTDDRFSGDQRVAEAVVVIDSSGLAVREPNLAGVSYLRSVRGDTVWALDNERGALFGFDRRGSFLGRIFHRGRKAQELSIPLALDVSPQGTAWVVDVGNAKLIGRRSDGTIRELALDFQPGGIAAVDDNDLWVAGDLTSSVFVRLDSSGHRTGVVGIPADTGRVAFRSNQGVAIRGAESCAALWAYAYRSIIECYALDGHRVWRANGPVPVFWPPNADPLRMSASDRLAYNDIAVSGDRVFALFSGATGPPDTRVLQVFSLTDGRFLGEALLPRPVRYLHVDRTSAWGLMTDSVTDRASIHIFSHGQ